jgi:hypothetical protein
MPSHTLRSVLAALAAGLRIALLSPARPLATAVTPAAFVTTLLLSALASYTVAWFAVEPPRAFSSLGVQSEGFYILAELAACFLVCTAFARRERMLWLATLIVAAGLVANTMTTLFYDHLLEPAMEQDQRVYWGYLAFAIAWWVAIWQRALATLGLGTPRRQHASAIVVVAALALLPYAVHPYRMWDRDYAELYDRDFPKAPSLVAEEVFSSQPAIVERALTGLTPGIAGRPDLYFVAFGPYGDQDVFLKESLYSARLFATRFGAHGRSLALVNSPRKVKELPLASVTNLERVLARIGATMEPAEDILFLFLTSHGSRDGTLSVELDNLSFRPLTAPVLAAALKDSGIRWKVLVVSGCYSGTFLDALKDEHTLVISASRADRTSFGCSDGAEFTYFGRAYFEQALNQTRSFTEAFALADQRLAEWESREGRQRSEPQMVVGERIEAHLARWRATLD